MGPVVMSRVFESSLGSRRRLPNERILINLNVQPIALFCGCIRDLARFTELPRVRFAHFHPKTSNRLRQHGAEPGSSTRLRVRHMCISGEPRFC